MRPKRLLENRIREVWQGKKTFDNNIGSGEEIYYGNGNEIDINNKNSIDKITKN